MQNDIAIGATLICRETGMTFTAAQDGCSVNYARDDAGNVYSDLGVLIREKRALKERSGPCVVYLSGDGRYVTTWKGSNLGTVIQSRSIKLSRWSYAHGATIQAISVRDVHGGFWHGRGSAGMSVTLRPCKP